MMSPPSLTIAFIIPLLALYACGPTDPEDADAGSCDLDVVIGTTNGDVFVPFVDGSTSELILGFQGVRMLRFALSVDGRIPTTAEVSAFVTVESESIELSQRTRERVFTETANGFIVESWLVFFNDTPAASLIGRDTDIEVIVRADGCVGGTRLRVAIRDDNSCVDQTIVIDAGVNDAGTLDAISCDPGM